MFETIRRYDIVEYQQSIKIAEQVIEETRTIDERINAFENIGYTIHYIPSDIRVGGLLKFEIEDFRKYIMNISSRVEYFPWGHGKAFVVLKSEVELRKDKVKHLKKMIEKNNRL